MNSERFSERLDYILGPDETFVPAPFAVAIVTGTVAAFAASPEGNILFDSYKHDEIQGQVDKLQATLKADESVRDALLQTDPVGGTPVINQLNTQISAEETAIHMLVEQQPHYGLAEMGVTYGLAGAQGILGMYLGAYATRRALEALKRRIPALSKY